MLPLFCPADRNAHETLEDYEFIRWFLLHDRATVFKEDDDWYLLVHTECEHLQTDNRCGIYETRPQVCRDYTTKDCEYDDDWTYDFYLETSGPGGGVHRSRPAQEGQKDAQPQAGPAADHCVSR